MATDFIFVPETHAYLLDGKQVPSVTQVLNTVGMVCYEHIPKEVLDHKAQIGTAAHAACHYLDEGDLDASTLDAEVEPYVAAWQRFRRETDFMPELIEHRGVAKVDGMQYGYTLDRAGVLRGRACLIEIKCTAGVEMSWGPQLAAYEMALREQDHKTRQRVVVHLRPNRTYQLIPYSSVMDYQVFKWALGIVHWERSKGKYDGNGTRNPGRS